MGHRVISNVTKTTIGFKADNNHLATEDLISTLQFFPTYGVLFKDAHSHLLSENGPLPVSHRHFIAIMVRLTQLLNLVIIFLHFRRQEQPAVHLLSKWRKERFCRLAEMMTG